MPQKTAKLTPMMERYQEVKRETPGSLLLFRMGDFYELFNEDAVAAAKLLGLTLTSRDKGSENPVPMAGFPHHALDGYLQKLIRAGHKAAICDQVEDPKQAKGLVRREVTRIVTPGTLTDDALLDAKENNFVASLLPLRDAVGVAWLELSTGRFQCMELQPAADVPEEYDRPFGQLMDELARLQPAECLIPDDERDHAAATFLRELDGTVLTERPAWCFAATACRETLLNHFGTNTLEGFDVDLDSAGVTAAGALLDYVQETQKASLGHILRLEAYHRGTNLLIDDTTRRSLELTRTLREGRRDGSLLGVMDETVTSMGARQLAEWLSNPLTDAAAIHRRLDAVEELAGQSALCRDIRDQLERAYDLQRLCSRVATLRASPRDLSALAATLALLPKLKAKLAGRSADLLRTLEARLDLCGEVRTDIETVLVDDPPVQITDGGIIRGGFSAQLDELRDLARGGKQWIAAYQQQEIERTGIQSLKVGFNKVFGYYLEVTAANKDKVPDDYIRKQTLKNQERFVTPELKEYEEKVLRAEERAVALEQQLFADLKQRTCDECRRLLETADVLAVLDTLASLATLAVAGNYCRPELTSDPILDIRDARHPVLDRLQPSGEFVPNDVLLGCAVCDESADADDQSTGATVALITGPNMAGKSTYIRQTALVTIMAQMGSFVPAAAARIGIADRIFARVGASDELQKGQSTFMVEMTETARILNAASERSLVILDEIGRGTSTYDGISLAWAITEYLHDVVKCRTLFATHYHELTDLPETLPRTANWNVAVHEQDGDVIFLHRIVPGSADRSYGIHVARLAGVPRSVIDRASVILETLEADHHDDSGKPTIPARTQGDAGRQLSLFPDEPHPLLDEIKSLNLDEMTPLAALQELHRMRERLR
ncbi:MAG: DNA mismatch repair protein MutS [Planctomycetota bacterium]|nr:MAG: DNA mismatch repair protein MutS [Planctomycetota bacterium]